jgi:hypothetical protein
MRIRTVIVVFSTEYLAAFDRRLSITWPKSMGVAFDECVRVKAQHEFAFGISRSESVGS